MTLTYLYDNMHCLSHIVCIWWGLTLDAYFWLDWLYDEVLPYMYDVVFCVNVMYEVKDDVYGLFVSLLCMCEVMGLHIYIALVCLDCD